MVFNIIAIIIDSLFINNNILCFPFTLKNVVSSIKGRNLLARERRNRKLRYLHNYYYFSFLRKGEEWAIITVSPFNGQDHPKSGRNAIGHHVARPVLIGPRHHN